MGSFAVRYAAARRHLPAFDLSGYRGLGRLDPDQLDRVFEDYLCAVDLARAVERSA